MAESGDVSSLAVRTAYNVHSSAGRGEKMENSKVQSVDDDVEFGLSSRVPFITTQLHGVLFTILLVAYFSVTSATVGVGKVSLFRGQLLRLVRHAY